MPWCNREVADQARRLRSEVQVADFKAKASSALAASIMQDTVELDQVREQLADGDPVCSGNRQARIIQWPHHLRQIPLREKGSDDSR